MTFLDYCLLGVALLTCGALAGRGVYFIRGGKPKANSFEYFQMLVRVNMFNDLFRHGPEQRKLTDSQIRGWGVVYVITSLLAFALFVWAIRI